jgi:hypothetical protein
VPTLESTVACVFCREPIKLGSFVEGAHCTRTTSCTNCGLRVSVTEAAWTQWCATDTQSVAERTLGERLRARRVAIAAQLILEQVALSSDPDGVT